MSQDVVAHFTDRAARYDRSSRWCTDPALRDRVLGLLRPGPGDEVLDVACGTGLVSRWFKGRVRRVVGLDLTPAMFEQARPHVDELVAGRAEAMPFDDDRFDLVICRQGTQFMDDAAAVREMVRVARPGGRVCLVNLCAYGPEDRDAFFEILRWRNPARRNFYLREDLARLLRDAGCDEVAVHDHVSVEDVDAWSDNGAIGEDRREAIRAVYRRAGPAFRRLHAVEIAPGRIVDHMLFGIAIGRKPG